MPVPMGTRLRVGFFSILMKVKRVPVRTDTNVPKYQIAAEDLYGQQSSKSESTQASPVSIEGKW